MRRSLTPPRRGLLIMPAQAGEAVTPARYLGGDTRLSRRLEQAHVVIGFEGLSYAGPGYYALQVFTNAVGGGMSSPAFPGRHSPKTAGLAYTVYSFHWGYADTGLFGVFLRRDEQVAGTRTRARGA